MGPEFQIAAAEERQATMSDAEARLREAHSAAKVGLRAAENALDDAAHALYAAGLEIEDE